MLIYNNSNLNTYSEEYHGHRNILLDDHNVDSEITSKAQKSSERRNGFPTETVYGLGAMLCRRSCEEDIQSKEAQ